jgi:hypothetical protein
LRFEGAWRAAEAAEEEAAAAAEVADDAAEDEDDMEAGWWRAELFPHFRNCRLLPNSEASSGG